jgi:predicted membrane GTPase involved in stress response
MSKLEELQQSTAQWVATRKQQYTENLKMYKNILEKRKGSSKLADNTAAQTKEVVVTAINSFLEE